MWLPSLCMAFLAIIYGSAENGIPTHLRSGLPGSLPPRTSPDSSSAAGSSPGGRKSRDVGTEYLSSDDSDKSLSERQGIFKFQPEDEDQLKKNEEQQLNLDPNYGENGRLNDSRELAPQLSAEQFEAKSGLKQLSNPRKRNKSKKRRRKKKNNRYRYMNDERESKKQDLWRNKNGLSFRKADEGGQDEGASTGGCTTPDPSGSPEGEAAEGSSKASGATDQSTTPDPSGTPPPNILLDIVRNYIFGTGGTPSNDDIYVGILKPLNKLSIGGETGETGETGGSTGGSGATTGGSGATTGGSEGTTGGSGATTGGSGATTGGTGGTTHGTTK